MGLPWRYLSLRASPSLGHEVSLSTENNIFKICQIKFYLMSW